MKERSLGRQLLVEYYNCGPGYLNNVEYIRESMNEAAIIAGATVVGKVFHRFSPYGVSGVVVIAESHLAIHTWPEFNYAAVDLFTCGADVDPYDAFKYLKTAFNAEFYDIQEVERGMIDSIIQRKSGKLESMAELG